MNNIPFLFFGLFILVGCINVSETIPDPDEIPNDPVELFVNGRKYTIRSTVLKKSEKFNRIGYKFFFLDTTFSCNTTEYILGAEAGAEIFLEADDLSIGQFEASGPFIGNTSYFGCDVQILEVNEGMIIAKVSGGDKKNNEYIEGKFSALRCE